MSALSRGLPLVLLGAVAEVVASAIGWAVFASGRLPDGPVELVWDKAACAACGMHVGEPGFAAQLITQDGRVQAFDDPGCLFLHLDQVGDVHAIWFRHVREPRWIAADRVAFADAEVTPMGFGLAAVDAGSPDTIGFDAARQRCVARVDGGRR